MYTWANLILRILVKNYKATATNYKNNIYIVFDVYEAFRTME